MIDNERLAAAHQTINSRYNNVPAQRGISEQDIYNWFEVHSKSGCVAMLNCQSKSHQGHIYLWSALQRSGIGILVPNFAHWDLQAISWKSLNRLLEQKNKLRIFWNKTEPRCITILKRMTGIQSQYLTSIFLVDWVCQIARPKWQSAWVQINSVQYRTKQLWLLFSRAVQHGLEMLWFINNFKLSSELYSFILEHLAETGRKDWSGLPIFVCRIILPSCGYLCEF